MPKPLLVFIFSLFLGSCTEEVTPDTEVLGLKYFPIKTGDYWIYQVTETSYNNQLAAESGDSLNYLIRERVDTVFKDLTDEDTYKITRSRRNSASEVWTQDSVFTINKSSSDVRITQNNVRKVNFLFPVSEGKRWNPHIFNTKSGVDNKSEEKFYYFTNIHQAFQVNGTTYPNTVQVVQILNNNVIERQDAYEVYGYGVGRIFKQVISFNYCSDPDRQNNCQVGKDFIITGIKRVEKLQEYGSTK